MRSYESPVSYLDQVSLDRLADKKALDSYLCKQKEQGGDVRFLMTEKLRDSVRDLVSGLTPSEQRIIRLRFWDDQSVEDIAESLGLRPAEIRELLTKTLAKLRSHILTECQPQLTGARGGPRGPVDFDANHT